MFFESVMLGVQARTWDLFACFHSKGKTMNDAILPKVSILLAESSLVFLMELDSGSLRSEDEQ